MITPMKKYSFLVFYKDYPEFIDKIRDLGVIHIQEKKAEEKQSKLKGKFEQIKKFDRAIKFLERRGIEQKGEANKDPQEILQKLKVLQKFEEHNQQKIGSLEKEMTRLEPWGDYHKRDIVKLEKEGYTITLFSCPGKRFQDSWNEQYSIQIISKIKGTLFFAVIHKLDEEVTIDAEKESIAEIPLSKIKELYELRSSRVKRIQETYDEMAVHCIPVLKRGKEEVLSDIRYHSAFIDTDDEAEGNLKLLEGWVPEPKEQELVEFLENSEAYFISTEPDEKEYPPILLENDKYASKFEPVAKLFDLPNYKELDLTPFFAPFFMLFFGFCLGDAGYGLLFVLIAFIAKRKVKKEFKPILTLAQYLGLATVLFGALSGTFFGINLIDTGYTLTQESFAMLSDANIPATIVEKLQALQGTHFEARTDFLEALRQQIGEQPLAEYKRNILKYTESDYSFLNSFRHLMQNPLNMFYLSMLIGGVNIIFGKIVFVLNMTKRRGFKYGISTIGWILLILTMVVFMGGDQMGMIEMEQNKTLFNVSLMISGALIIFFNNPDSNIFMRPLNAVWDAYNVVTGVFGDLLSYIRLFALGISSAILGFVFNDISTQLLGIPYVGWLFFLILLVFGHAINIFLASLGAFIHPMRLIFVEFYKNAGFTGGGKEYKPFTK